MGLDLESGNEYWHASYGYFAYLRDVIARAAGFDRESHYEGRYTAYALKGYWIDLEDFDMRMSVVPLEGIPVVEDDLDYLMLHSDCDGILPSFAAGKVADRVSGLICKIQDADDRESVQTLVDFLRKASENGSVVEFL